MTRRFLVSLSMAALAAASLAACAADPAASPALEDARANLPGEKAAAQAIRTAYQQRDGRAHRLASTAALARLKAMSRKELDQVLGVYRQVVAEGGAAGLEALLASAVAELASRNQGGADLARAHLVALDALIGTIDGGPPHARAALARPHDPVIRFVPVSVARAALSAQMSGLVTDLETAFDDGSCSDARLEELAARFGQETADRLRALCEGGATATPSAGGRGNGWGGALSAFDCLLDHEPTRAERVGQLMQECMLSMDGDPDANPYADGNVFRELLPLRREESREVSNLEGGDILVKTFDISYIKVREITMKEHEDGDVSIKTDYFNGQDEKVFGSEVRFDPATDEVEQVTLTDSTGKTTWTVKYGKDKNGNTTVDVTAYDENGNPIPESQEQMPGVDGWGQTEECAALTLALIEDRVDESLEGDGIDPPPSVINPDPNADEVDAEEADCLGLTGGMLVDDSFECMDALVSCDVAEVVDSSCSCKGPELLLAPDRQCSLFMDCGDAATVDEDGVCTCANPDEEFVDDGFGGDPIPGPGPDPGD
ncbi:MAG TPA: hypothetical protein VIG06_26230 [Kofleriaceae bacterium]|jgi:hypothetical protein